LIGMQLVAVWCDWLVLLVIGNGLVDAYIHNEFEWNRLDSRAVIYFSLFKLIFLSCLFFQRNTTQYDTTQYDTIRHNHSMRTISRPLQCNPMESCVCVCVCVCVCALVEMNNYVNQCVCMACMYCMYVKGRQLGQDRPQSHGTRHQQSRHDCGDSQEEDAPSSMQRLEQCRDDRYL